MHLPPRAAIVADGRRRILEGSGREAACRIKARFTYRAAPLIERASWLGRLVIRYRIARFIQRQMARRAPPGALYVRRELRCAKESGHSSPLVSQSQTSNKSLEPTAGRRTETLKDEL